MNTSRAVRALSDAVQVRTVSYSDRALMDSSEFERFHALLEATFPLSTAGWRNRAGHNLLIRGEAAADRRGPGLAAHRPHVSYGCRTCRR